MSTSAATSRPELPTIAIIGAGAAGLFATIFAARHAAAGTRVLALDGAKRLGAKILIAGGGRCNVTHDVVRVDDYAGGPGSSRHNIKRILQSFSVADTVEFFAARGVTLKREDTGKLFPTTNKARTVLDALLEAATEAGATLQTHCRVTGLDGGIRFRIDHEQGQLFAHRVILCTGGRALPATGSDGFGYGLVKALGHTVSRTWPALVPLTYAPGPPQDWLRDLKGIALNVELAVRLPSGKVLHRQGGSMLLAHFGVTGPAAMDISRHLTASRREHGESNVQLTANLLPQHTADWLDADLIAQTRQQPRLTLLQWAEPHLPSRLAAAIVERAAGLAGSLPLAQLSRAGRQALVQSLTALPLPVLGDRGYDHAEVTAGGVPLSEVEPATMHSRLCPGLYLAGELLDVDGRIGGYNFQWAWCTGRLAGLAAAQSLGRGEADPPD